MSRLDGLNLNHSPAQRIFSSLDRDTASSPYDTERPSLSEAPPFDRPQYENNRLQGAWQRKDDPPRAPPSQGQVVQMWPRAFDNPRPSMMIPAPAQMSAQTAPVEVLSQPIPALPPKEQILGDIMEKDDEIAQLEHELEQAMKSRERLQRVLDSPQEELERAFAKNDDDGEPMERERAELNKSLPSTALHIANMTRQHGDQAREKVEAKLRPRNASAGEGDAVFSSFSALPHWQGNLNEHAHKGRRLVKERLRRDIRETLDEKRKLEREYTRRWIGWRARLIDNNALEDESDDELFNTYRTAIGKPKLRWSRADAAASSRALIPRERFLRTLVDTPPLVIRGPNTVTSYRYVNTNHAVENARQEDATHRQETAWLPHEEEIFVTMFKKLNKDFVKIAAHLPGRTVKDVIKFYYVNKRRLGLKKFSIALRSYQQTAMEDSSLPLTNPLAHDDPDNFGSTLSWSNRNGQRSSMRLTTKKSVNYSERALEQAALGVAGEVWSSQHPPSDEEEEEVAWSELEKERFLDAHDRFQADFRAIAQFMKTKTIGQVKQFYNANKKDFGVMTLAPPLPKTPGQPKLPKSKLKPEKPEVRQSPPKAFIKKEKKEPDPSAPLIPKKPKTPKKPKPVASPPAIVKSEPEPPPSTPWVCAWNDDQKSLFVALFSMHGRNWGAIASMMTPLTAEEVLDFYSNMREELDLDQLLPEGVRRTRGVGGPTRGSGGSGTFSPQIMSPGPRKQGGSKMKKSTEVMTSSQDFPVDVEGGLSSSKKRKRDETEQTTDAPTEPPAKVPRVSNPSETATPAAPASTSTQTLVSTPLKASPSAPSSTTMLAPVESSLRKLSEAPPELKLDIEREIQRLSGKALLPSAPSPSPFASSMFPSPAAFLNVGDKTTANAPPNPKEPGQSPTFVSNSGGTGANDPQTSSRT